MKKLKKPTTITEVETYDIEIAHELFNLLKGKMEVSVDGIEVKDLFSSTYSKPTETKHKVIPSQDDLKLGEEMVKEGQIPGSILILPPVFFPQSLVESGVPYLHVKAVSWFNRERPSSTYHMLLSRVKELK